MSTSTEQQVGIDSPRHRSNRDIDSFIVHGEFHIELEWAMQELAHYLNEIDVLEAGANFADLGLASRRQAQRPSIVTFVDGVAKTVDDPKLLRDEVNTQKGSFALLRLDGVMRSRDGMSTQGISTLIGDLRAANQNENIDGILIEANTGGGEVTAGQMLLSAIEQSPKAVVVYAHFLASGGVMGTLAADEIIASGPQARIGSIGTYVTLDKTIGNWYSRYYEEIYADKSTNKNADWRAYLRGDYGPIRNMVNKTNDTFLEQVMAYRELRGDSSKIEDTLSGQVFFAKEAKSRGLIDGIGSFQYAINRLAANVRRRKSK